MVIIVNPIIPTERSEMASAPLPSMRECSPSAKSGNPIRNNITPNAKTIGDADP